MIIYSSHLKSKAASLRKNATPGERRLWKYLKGKKMLGYDFNRQKPLLNYIVDFYCVKLKLVIEIDGISHMNKYYYDRLRQKELERQGIKFLRFSEHEAFRETDKVRQVIEAWIMQKEKEEESKNTPPFGHPSPPALYKR